MKANLEHPTPNFEHRKRDAATLEVSPKTNRLRQLKHFFDYIGGSEEELPIGIKLPLWWRGLWWGILAGLILLFCGQTSKFIYIDF
jgi:hypothetical protein